jgi:hypothetical protein
MSGSGKSREVEFVLVLLSDELHAEKSPTKIVNMKNFSFVIVVLSFQLLSVSCRPKMTANVLRLALSGVTPTPSHYKYNKTFHSAADFP